MWLDILTAQDLGSKIRVTTQFWQLLTAMFRSLCVPDVVHEEEGE